MSAERTPAHRYAVYFAPAPGSAWWEAGSRWLGRCAASQAALVQPAIRGVGTDVLRQLTAEPRRYGWHATLKAPFALGTGVQVDDLREAVQALAAELGAFDLPPLGVQRLGHFLALCPTGDQSAINAVANACVTRLHPLVAPLSSGELERRRRKGSMTPQEDALLERWGYPYVLERYRFHLSLTGGLDGWDADTVGHVERTARAWFSDLPTCRFNSLALFAEPAPGADFVLVEHMGFGR
jgi:putative phosphonate metabolism protein